MADIMPVCGSHATYRSTIRGRYNRRIYSMLGICDARKMCKVHSSTSPRLATVSLNAVTATRDFIRELIEYPAIEFEKVPIFTQARSLLSRVWRSVMKTNHRSLRGLTVKIRRTWSPCADSPGLVFLPWNFLLNSEN